jgi:hypothetical protein
MGAWVNTGDSGIRGKTVRASDQPKAIKEEGHDEKHQQQSSPKSHIPWSANTPHAPLWKELDFWKGLGRGGSYFADTTVKRYIEKRETVHLPAFTRVVCTGHQGEYLIKTGVERPSCPAHQSAISSRNLKYQLFPGTVLRKVLSKPPRGLGHAELSHLALPCHQCLCPQGCLGVCVAHYCPGQDAACSQHSAGENPA